MWLQDITSLYEYPECFDKKIQRELNSEDA